MCAIILFTEEYVTITCTRDSGKFIFSATSSRMNISGYLVFWNNDSMTSNWARVNVVRSLLCFLGLPGAYGDTEKRGKYTFRNCKMTFRLFRKRKIHAFNLKKGNACFAICGAVCVRSPMCLVYLCFVIFSEPDFFSIYKRLRVTITNTQASREVLVSVF